MSRVCWNLWKVTLGNLESGRGTCFHSEGGNSPNKNDQKHWKVPCFVLVKYDQRSDTLCATIMEVEHGGSMFEKVTTI